MARRRAAATQLIRASHPPVPDQLRPAQAQVDPHQVGRSSSSRPSNAARRGKRGLGRDRHPGKAQPARQQQAAGQVVAAGHQRHRRQPAAARRPAAGRAPGAGSPANRSTPAPVPPAPSAADLLLQPVHDRPPPRCSAPPLHPPSSSRCAVCPWPGQAQRALQPLRGSRAPGRSRSQPAAEHQHHHPLAAAPAGCGRRPADMDQIAEPDQPAAEQQRQQADQRRVPARRDRPDSAVAGWGGRGRRHASKRSGQVRQLTRVAPRFAAGSCRGGDADAPAAAAAARLGKSRSGR